jgi:TonB family protein
MLNRGDLRMLTVIVCTASLAAIATVAVVKIASSDARTSSLEARVAKLEAPPPLPAPPPPPPAPPAVLHDVVPDPAPCDEVSCVLDNYEPVCCAKFRKLSDGLDREAISTGVGEIRPLVTSCDDLNAKGRVKVSVKVLPDGTVSSVTVLEAPNTALATCVSNAMQRARFTPTVHGGSFRYPFIF